MRLPSILPALAVVCLAPGCGGLFFLDQASIPEDPETCGECSRDGCPARCASLCPTSCQAGGDSNGTGAGGTGGGDLVGGDAFGLGDGLFAGDNPLGGDTWTPPGDLVGGDTWAGDLDGGDVLGAYCNGVWCDLDEECVGGVVCLDECEFDRCAYTGACCPASSPVCVYDRFCQEACPSPSDERCGATGEICCNSTGSMTCGSSLTCVLDCLPGQELCGTGEGPSGESTYGTTCCGLGQVCVFDECRSPSNCCAGFSDCAPDEYCEYVLDCPGCDVSGDCDTTGLCMLDEAPPDTADCQGNATDLFEPVYEWHWVGVTEAGCTAGQTCPGTDCTDFGLSSCYKNLLTSPAVADMDRVEEAELVWTSPISGKTITFPPGRYPEVVFKAYGNGLLDDSRIVILDGRTGETKMIIAGDRGGYGNPALGNIDDDPKLELLNLENTGLMAYDPFYNDPRYDGPAITNELDAEAQWQGLWGSAQNSGYMGYNFQGGSAVLTDLNGDGRTEIVVAGNVLDGPTGRHLVFANNLPTGTGGMGDLSSGTSARWWIPVVADVDLDDVPELIIGDRAYEVTVACTCNPACDTTVQHCITDGAGGCTCAAGAGQNHWWEWTQDWDSTAIGGGYPGVGNFVDNTSPPYDAMATGTDRDYPEVVVLYNGSLAFLNGLDGSVINNGFTDLSFTLFDDYGGPTNIADFDGDGRVEVSFAGTGCMVVIDPDCVVEDSDSSGDFGAGERAALATVPDSGCAVDPSTFTGCTVGVPAGNQNPLRNNVGVLWMNVTQDVSSARTGTSVFDFQGDGKAEVLYGDECFFRVYDGETGTVVMERPNSSRTATEYPIVVDVDGDGNSEILVAGNNDQSSSARDCCYGSSTTNCPAGRRPSSPGRVSYWRTSNPLDAQYYALLDLYDYSFCSCGHLTSQITCDRRSGCAWNLNTDSCGVFACTTPPQSSDQTDCDATTGCAWSAGACGVMDCAGLSADETACRDAVPCLWTGSACEVRPDRPDDPADICTSGTWGLWSLGDQEDRWVQTLPQWHQHGYHVTEVDLDGNPVADWGAGNNNWDIYNNLRQNVQGYAPLNAPDLQIYSLTAGMAECPTILLYARVVNRGRAGIAAGVPIVFYVAPEAGGPGIPFATVPLPYALLPGLGADVSAAFSCSVITIGTDCDAVADCSWMGASCVPTGSPPVDGYDFTVIANPADGIEPAFECHDDNNERSVLEVECPSGG